MNNNHQLPLTTIELVLQMVFQLNNTIQENTRVINQRFDQVDERLTRMEDMLQTGTLEQQEQQHSPSPSPPPLPIMIDQEVMIPTPFDHTQRIPSGEYHPPRVVLTTDEEHRLTNRATAYRPPALRSITNNVIPKPPSQGKPEIIKHFINNPETWASNAFMRGSLVANFLLRKAVTIREAREAPSGTSLVTRTTSMDTTSVMSGVIGQAAGSPGPSSSFRSVTSAMST
ncbi:hypothetical protein BDC45DRAFT_576936 [Circinella umbellata]|nr:hypothetical protein BDC45DRAFT_576936 [Circinella umbellata]